MEMLAAMPEFLVWCAAGAAGVVALAVVAKLIERAFDLEAG